MKCDVGAVISLRVKSVADLRKNPLSGVVFYYSPSTAPGDFKCGVVLEDGSGDTLTLTKVSGLQIPVEVRLPSLSAGLIT